jgi:hypothetical protein
MCPMVTRDSAPRRSRGARGADEVQASQTSPRRLYRKVYARQPGYTEYATGRLLARRPRLGR